MTQRENNVDVDGDRGLQAKRASVLLSLEVLRRYCQLDGKYVDIESPGQSGASIMDDPANLLSLSCTAHAKFDAFALCFVPTQVGVTSFPLSIAPLAI